jgi:hypothetical protein
MSVTNDPTQHRPVSGGELAAREAVVAYILANYNRGNLTGRRVPDEWADPQGPLAVIQPHATVPAKCCVRLLMPPATTYRAAVAVLLAEQAFADWVISEFDSAGGMSGTAAPVAGRPTVCPAAVSAALGLPDGATFAAAVMQADALLRALAQ